MAPPPCSRGSWPPSSWPPSSWRSRSCRSARSSPRRTRLCSWIVSLRRGDRITEYAEWPDGQTELRGFGGGHCYGRFLLDLVPGHPLPPEEARLVAVAPAAQAGAALDTAGLSHQG